MSDSDLSVSSAAPDTAAPAAKQEPGNLSDPLQQGLSDPLSGGSGGPGGPSGGRGASKVPNLMAKLEGGGKTELKDGVEGQVKPAKQESNDAQQQSPEEQQENPGQKKGPAISLQNEDEYKLELTVPIPGVPMEVSVTAKAKIAKDTKVNKDIVDKTKAAANTKTKISAEITASVAFSVLFFKIGLRAIGRMEAEIEGDKGLVEGIQIAVKEFTRWRLSDELDAVASRLKKVDAAVSKRRPSIEGSFDALLAATNPANAKLNNEDIAEQAGTENSWINPSRTILENIRKESKDLKADLQGAAGINDAGDADKAADYFLNVGAISERVRKVAELAKASASPVDIHKAAVDARSATVADLDGAVNEAYTAVNEMNFKTPTPGVKVSGAIAAEVFAGFDFGKAAKGEVAVGGAMKFDTGKTKKENVKVGNKEVEKEVFDKTFDKALTLNAKFESFGFGGSVSAELVFSGGGKQIAGTVDLETPELPLGIVPSDLNDAVKLAQTFMSDETLAANEELKKAANAKKNEGEAEDNGRLKKLIDSMKAFAKKMSPVIESFKFAKDKADRIMKGELGLTKILVGGGFEIGATSRKGSVYVGLGTVKELDIDLPAVKAKAGKMSSTKINAEWGG